MRNDLNARNEQIAALNLRQGYEAPLRARIAELEASMRHAAKVLKEGGDPAIVADGLLVMADEK